MKGGTFDTGDTAGQTGTDNLNEGPASQDGGKEIKKGMTQKVLAKRIRMAAEGRSRSDYEKIYHLTQMRWNQVQHPLGGLGLLEDQIAQIAGLTLCTDVSLDKKAVVIFCADNGVTAEGIAQTDSSVTGIVARRMAEGKTAVCRMAAKAGADVIPVDMGMKDFSETDGILNRRVANGTGNIFRENAMTRQQAEAAILTGIDLAEKLSKDGYRLLGAGERGSGNTTTASACACVLLGADPARMTGKGAGLTEEGLRHKIEVVQGAIRRSGFDRRFSFREEGIRQADTRQADTGQADARQKAVKKSPGSETAPDAIEVLRSVGGFDLLGMCGLYLGGWICQIPVLIDGFVSSVAALAAVRICPACADAILASHRSSEPAAGTVLEALGKKPLITGNLHLGEGTGAVLAMPMLDMALSVYKESVLFGEGGVRQYREL